MTTLNQLTSAVSPDWPDWHVGESLVAADVLPCSRPERKHSDTTVLEFLSREFHGRPT